MATRYPSDYDNRSRVEPGISRGTTRGGSTSRSGSAQRSGSARGYSEPRRTASGQRPAQRASSSRQGYSQRPAQRTSSSGARRPGQPARKGGRRRPNNRFPVFVGAVALVVVALILLIAKPFGRPKADPVTDVTAVPVSNPAPAPAESAPFDEADAVETPQYDNISDQLADSDYDVGSLSEADMAKVSDLRMNTSLPSEWLNILLLGTDERVLNDSARTDAMIICSVNRNTGEMKLSSIMRDLAVEFNDIGKYSGTYRINAANYFGGPNLAMRTVNEKFNMNIQYYVMVNFFGFQKIAQQLGGIDIDITEEEMNQINKWAYNSYRIAKYHGIDVSDVEYAKLETYGQNVHLNGTQTLAYARIRKLQGGDYMRAQRQRTVLGKLLEKAKQLDAIQMAALAGELLSNVKTNLPVDDMFPLAVQVSGNGLSGVKSMQLPVSGSYKEEVRNEQAMLYDCDFAANAIQLYNFIYEG